MKKSLPPLLTIIRPGNVLITGLTVFFGGLISIRQDTYSLLGLSLASISAALVAAGANTLNDYYDIATDLVNRPDRALPSGKLSRASAVVWGWSLSIAGVAIGFWLSSLIGLVALAVGVLLWQYNRQLKKTCIWGNLTVAVCAGTAFIYGGLAVGRFTQALIPAGFAFLIHFAREIVKDVQDVEGDRRIGAKTLPIVVGERKALTLAAILMFLLAISTLLPWMFNIYSQNYLLLVVSTVALPLIVISSKLFIGISAIELKQVSFFLKFIMITGLIALYVG